MRRPADRLRVPLLLRTGGSSQPSEMQVLIYAATLAVTFILMRTLSPRRTAKSVTA